MLSWTIKCEYRHVHIEMSTLVYTYFPLCTNTQKESNLYFLIQVDLKLIEAPTQLTR